MATAACRKAEEAPPQAQATAPAPAALAELKVGVIPVAECAILYDQQVFARHGFKLSFQAAASGTQISDGVVGRGLDFGYSNLVTPLLAASHGIPLRVIGPISLENDERARHGLIVRADSGIAAPLDLKGKTIGLNALRNIDHLLLLRWLKAKGVDVDSVKFQTVPFPNMIATLDNKGLDAVALVEPFITIARTRSDQYHSLGNYMSNTTAAPTAVSGFIAREDWLTADAARAAHLIAALNEAAARATSDVGAFRTHVVAMTKVDPAVAETMPLPWYSTTSFAAEFSELAATAQAEGFVEQPINATTLIYPAAGP